jgi:guanylate kinase
MEFEMGYSHTYDEIIRNVDIQKTIARLMKIIDKKRNSFEKSKIKEKV